MNSWYVEGIELFMLFSLIICFVILLVMLIFEKKHNKATRAKGILLSLDTIIFACSLVFVLFHSTYYKYNDWSILNSNIHSVHEKYGEFDKGTIQEGKSGKVGYFIYTDNGSIMPDHADHYYWIYFDENGNVYKVEDSLTPGA